MLPADKLATKVIKIYPSLRLMRASNTHTISTLLQKKPKIMGKDHGLSEVSKHSTSTETMFFEKVSIVIFRDSIKTSLICDSSHNHLVGK